METLIGILVGVVATVVVSHYYYRRTTRKSLAIYEILNTQIFAGIERSVRDQLRFTFREQEVQDLQQVEFLIANDGERAISNVIEPLRHDLPDGVRLLDGTILYRHPESLKAEIRTEQATDEATSLLFDFPLLNKGDFFLVKLLLSGRGRSRDFAFRILADDLPRSLTAGWLPPTAFTDRKLNVEWVPLGIGIYFAGMLGWSIWMLYLLYGFRPDLFPFPAKTYVISSESLLVVGMGVLTCMVIGAIAFTLIVMGGFESFSRAGPRFPLPKEFRHRGFGYRIHIPPEEVETMLDVERGVSNAETRSNTQLQPTPQKRRG